MKKNHLNLDELSSHLKKSRFPVYNFLKKHNHPILKFIKDKDRKSLNDITEFSLIQSALDGKAGEHIAEIERILKTRDKEFAVKSSGEIVGTGKYELLDIGWVESLIAFLKNYDDLADFQDNPPIINIPDETVIGIFSDFGTGNWSNSIVASTISNNIKNLNPDYCLHLGDVYYSGSAAESSDYLLDFWPVASKGNFTLNSNHEMYSGSKGYFYTTLANKIFAQQKQNSYFALENQSWVIVGLDSAYFADKEDLYMTANLNESQIAFLEKIALKNKKVIVLTHHNPIDNAGDNKMPIWDQVTQALGDNLKYWYFGHTHCGAVYEDIENVKCRLVGHGAVPYGDASDFSDSSKVIWYENAVPLLNNNGLRVQNGFLIAKLSNDNISEEFYGEDGKVHYSVRE
jgi:predicted phosphohydrolase